MLGGASEVLPLQEVGVQIVLAMLKGTSNHLADFEKTLKLPIKKI